MILLDGKKVSEHWRAKIKDQAHELAQHLGRAPQLTVILVGDDKASQVYVRNKHTACQNVGISSNIINLPALTSQQELNDHIHKLNEDHRVDGILVQLPLPNHLDKSVILEKLSPYKDADGMTYSSMGRLWSGYPVVKPCTPNGVMKILQYYNIPVAGKKAAVIGRSNIVGRPMAHLLTEANATVAVCHSQTQNISEITSEADIVVVAAGKARMFGKEYFKKDSIVIDVGMHGAGAGKLCGDVKSEELEGWVSALTPVPGGVGPMTITCLLENTLLLAKRRLELK